MMDYNIFLIGFMGAGKSAVSRELGKRLGRGIVEMDAQIEKEQGRSIKDIFAEDGEEHFRDLESALIQRLGEGEPAVISCGGGVILRPGNVEHMKGSGKVVYLAASPETVYERVKDSTERPILNGNMNVEYIAGLMRERRSKYHAAADVGVVTDGKSIPEICDEIVMLLGELEQGIVSR